MIHVKGLAPRPAQSSSHQCVKSRPVLLTSLQARVRAHRAGSMPLLLAMTRGKGEGKRRRTFCLETDIS